MHHTLKPALDESSAYYMRRHIPFGL